VAVFDLGLTDAQRREAAGWCGVDLRWAGGVPGGMPDHVRALENFAWKTLAVYEAASTAADGDAVLWLDAGVDVRAPLDARDGVLETLLRDGVFLSGADDDTPDHRDFTLLAAEGTFRRLGLPAPTDGPGASAGAAPSGAALFLKRPTFIGGIQGYAKKSRAYDAILVPAARCALDAGCIAPAGTSKLNHRFDQSALSALAHASGLFAGPAREAARARGEAGFEGPPLEPNTRWLVQGWRRRGDGRLPEDPRKPAAAHVFFAPQKRLGDGYEYAAWVRSCAPAQNMV
jgi:hypothetical protein